LAYISNILLTWKLWNWGWHCPVAPSWLRAWWQLYFDCRLQTSQWRAERGGEPNGATAPGIQGRGASKE